MCNEYRFKQALDRIAQEFSRLKLPLHWAGGAPKKGGGRISTAPSCSTTIGKG